MVSVEDKWALGSQYEEFMGRWSRNLARELVNWLDLPAGLDWLDVGCGTGSLAEAVCQLTSPASVTACDPAEPFISYAKHTNKDSRLSFVVAGVDNLPEPPNGYGSVSSLLALNFMPDPVRAIKQMSAVAAPKGTVSVCVWDYQQGMQFLRYFWDAATFLDESAEALDEGVRFPICRRDAMETLFQSCALTNVCCEAIEIPTVFADFADYWQPFLGQTGPAPSYVASLNDDARNKLAQALEATLKSESDGSIALTARAWAVRGVVA